MSPDVTEHDHCRFCGDVVPTDQAYCSMECYHNDQAKIKKEKTRELLWTVVAIAGVAVILTAGFLF